MLREPQHDRKMINDNNSLPFVLSPSKDSERVFQHLLESSVPSLTRDSKPETFFPTYDAAFTSARCASTAGRYFAHSVFQPSAFFLACSMAVSENLTIGVRAGPGFT